VLARAAREPRVIAGLALVLVAIGVGYFSLQRDRAEADRDYAYCKSAHPDCTTRRKPVYVVTSWSSGNGFRKQYSLGIRTGPHTTLTLHGLSADTAGRFRDEPTADVRYRHGHPTSVVAADGTSLEVPFIFSAKLLAVGGVAAALLLLGAGSPAWGLTRVNRSPGTA